MSLEFAAIKSSGLIPANLLGALSRRYLGIYLLRLLIRYYLTMLKYIPRLRKTPSPNQRLVMVVFVPYTPFHMVLGHILPN